MPTSQKNRSSSKLTIAGTAVEVTHELVHIDSLRLDPENPRIRFQFKHGTRKKPTNAEELLAIVRAQPGYEDLQKQIRKQGGIHDPLIVRHDGTIVEGNTRFAVISFLAKPDRSVEQWTTVPVMRLAKGVSERTILLLMADYHIAGKTTWRPAAQADQIYRMIEESGVSAQDVADATRMTVKKVQQYVEAYKYLLHEVIPEVESGGKVDRQEILEKKFSHALELITRNNLKAIRDNPAERKRVAKLIATDKIQGLEVRKLPALMQHAKAKEILIKDGFKPASDALKRADPTVDSKILVRQ
ncbi:hypothetical protein R75471_07314 [Paraburkholderia domus]|uniref:hypothetical protein n=1 Tax=Paraburkholderia domus TaxID=2793075 RepID=UPI001B1D8FE6|nr:hypothetical protein [Paraburkholderia domus]CAE6968927.1 hypothetical protein R75471_07314 [Paraburkholderia domus]